MRAWVVSQNGLDPVTSKLKGMLPTLLAGRAPEVATFDQLESALAESSADVVLLVLWPDPERALEALRKLRSAVTCPVLAIGQAADAKLILRTLQCGADHFLDQADLENELQAGFKRLQVKHDVAAPMGRQLAVLAASGGVGASTLAANLAVALAKDHASCALLDLNPGRGDLAALLDLKPQFTLADLCSHAGRLDRAMFEKMLVRHPCGVHLLGAPQNYTDLRAVTPAGVQQALNLARKYFPHVVVDAEDCFHEEQVVALRQATGILLVLRLDFTSLRNTRRVLEHLQTVDIARQRVRLVVNRHGQPNELPVAEVEDALGEKITFFVPDDPKTLNAANNAGEPALLKFPTAKVCQSLTELAKTSFESRKSTSSWFSLLRKK